MEKMKRVIAIVVFLMLSFNGCKTAKPEAKSVRVRLSPTEIFDLRTKCQAIVDKFDEEHFIGTVGNALTSEVTPHYNPATNRCYAEVEVTKNFFTNYPKTPTNYRSVVLYDAQTRQLLMHARQEGDQRSGDDYRDGKNPGSMPAGNDAYERVSEEIHRLMTQEDQ